MTYRRIISLILIALLILSVMSTITSCIIIPINLKDIIDKDKIENKDKNANDETENKDSGEVNGGVNTHLTEAAMTDVTAKADANKLFTLTNAEVPLTDADYTRLQRPNRPVASDGETKLYGCESADNFALQKDAFDAFNKMVTEFYGKTKNTKLWVKIAYNIQGGNVSYYANALAVKLDYVTDDENYTTASIYNVDDYEWLYDHAHEYGFVRVSDGEGEENIFKYVGLSHAKYIQSQQKKNKDTFYSLESYIAELKTTTSDTPIKISTVKKNIGESGTMAYYVYYMPADSAVVKLPTDKYAYTVMAIDGGYVVTYCKAETK